MRTAENSLACDLERSLAFVARHIFAPFSEPFSAASLRSSGSPALVVLTVVILSALGALD